MDRRWYPIAAAALLSAACSRPEKQEIEAPAPVQVTAVTQDTVRRVVGGDGVFFPRDQASVMPKIAAPVLKFHVNRGDRVRQGQLLADLESRDLAAAAAEAKSALDQAESNLRTTQGASVPDAMVKAQTDVEAARHAAEAYKRVLDSRRQLFEQGALPRRQVDEAQVTWTQANATYQAAAEHLRTMQAVSRDEQVRTATAQVAAARSHYQSLQAQLSYARIVSPIAGVVSDRPLYAGEMATPGTPLVTVMDISRVVARVNVPQGQAGTVKVGQAAVLTLPEGGDEIDGKVTVVSPATDANATTVQIWIEAPNPDGRLKPGASIHAAILTEVVKAATVAPASAILPGEEGGNAVLTVDSDSRAHRKKVELGIRDGDKVQILAGVGPGEEVVISGGMGVDDKAKVKVVDTSVKETEEEDEEPAGDSGTGKGEGKAKSK